ncbi:MAG: GNAT family N-acetyltransferase [bacterium]|nr:GNAT family N-acetyltransferase [bacterium]
MEIVRQASRGDIDRVIEVLDKAFNRNIVGDREVYEKKYREIEKGMDNWLVLEADGKVIGAVRIIKHWMRIGKSKILKGDVGEVSILPECQGKGYGHKLMEGTVRWMVENNYDISRLGGLCKFYKRFGYIRFPRRYIEIEIGRKAGAGASMVEEGEVMIEEEMLKKIDTFRAGDEGKCIKLRDEFNSRYNGSLIEESFGISPLFYVFREDGDVSGYIGGTRYEKEYSEFEARITIYQIAYRIDKPYVIQSLIKYINNLAYREGINRITLRIPFDPEIINAIKEIPVRFRLVETYGGISGNMLQVINMESLFRRLVPELEARLERSVMGLYTGVIRISIEKGNVILDIKRGKIDVVSNAKADTEIEIKEFYLLQLLLGLLSFSEVEVILEKKTGVKANERDLLNILFPRCPVFSGNWG